MYIKSWKTWLFFTYSGMIIYFSSQPGDQLFWINKLWKYNLIVEPRLEYWDKSPTLFYRFK